MNQKSYASLGKKIEQGELGLPECSKKLREWINEYFDVLVEAMETTMEKMDLVRKVTAKKVGHDRKGDGKKPFAPMDKLYQRLRKARTNLNGLDNALNKSTKDIERIIELRLVGKTPAQKMAEMSKTISWVRKKGKVTVEWGI